ncbi:MAG: hypothetical protein ACTTHM_08085 [Peptoanaerobacter stomatis]|uniref:hypothetical protein n=1 Tax=Peptoanaerobacter stomatis TaxID=796937 RepID=UPI003FA05252
MKTSEILKFVGKRVKLKLKNDKRTYIGQFLEDPYTQNCIRKCYKIINEDNYVTYVFRPSHVKSIEEMKINEKV